MPLIPGKGKKAFEKNVEIEIKAGKPQKQSLAIAYDMKRRNNKKMAEGGPVNVDAKEMAFRKELAQIEQSEKQKRADGRSNRSGELIRPEIRHQLAKKHGVPHLAYGTPPGSLKEPNQHGKASEAVDKMSHPVDWGGKDDVGPIHNNKDRDIPYSLSKEDDLQHDETMQDEDGYAEGGKLPEPPEGYKGTLHDINVHSDGPEGLENRRKMHEMRRGVKKDSDLRASPRMLDEQRAKKESERRRSEESGEGPEGLVANAQPPKLQPKLKLAMAEGGNVSKPRYQFKSNPEMVKSSAIKARLLDKHGNPMEEGKGPEQDKDPKNLKPGDHDDMEDRRPMKDIMEDHFMEKPEQEGEDEDAIPKKQYDGLRAADGGVLDKIGAAIDSAADSITGKTADQRAKAYGTLSGSSGPGKAFGGDISDEKQEERHDSLAAAIMAKRGLKKLAEGGQVDLDENQMEQPAHYIEKLNDGKALDWKAGDEMPDQPEDSNEKGHDLDDENEHDRVSAIRKRMKAKRQF